jgi:hypothetical protein
MYGCTGVFSAVTWMFVGERRSGNFVSEVAIFHPRFSCGGVPDVSFMDKTVRLQVDEPK